MMTTMTLEVPSDLAKRLEPVEDQLLQILEMGLREFHAASQQGYHGMAEVLEFLATLPSPEEILALRPSKVLQTRIQELLEKSRANELATDEEEEWERYEYLEHLVRIAKTKALLKLKSQ
ncbi:MAG: hypothetical protein Fur0022_13610 [Anaerolineales bacterium]